MAEVKKQKKMPRKKATKRQKMDLVCGLCIHCTGYHRPVRVLHLALFPESLVQL